MTTDQRLTLCIKKLERAYFLETGKAQDYVRSSAMGHRTATFPATAETILLGSQAPTSSRPAELQLIAPPPSSIDFLL